MVDRIGKRKCVAFLGSADSLQFNSEGGLPSAAELSQQLATACDYPGVDPRDFLRVAQYFETTKDRYELRTFLQSALDPDPPIAPTMVQRLIASLPFEYVLTTNFDTLMEDA